MNITTVPITLGSIYFFRSLDLHKNYLTIWVKDIK